MESLFYLAGLVAVIASLKVVTGHNAVHALLYLVVSLLAVAICFYLMGAPFAAGLEVIVYAGAILVLFVFAVLMFGLGTDETTNAPRNTNLANMLGAMLLAFALLVEIVVIINNADMQQSLHASVISSKAVGIMLYGPYLLAVEIASFLLLSGLLAGYHYAKPDVTGGPL
ncbi:NADH-quinone oxidoreductase subunit J [Colwellia sp. C1TZA3]|nr:NADH-quinone oxidoreductase subunit J [Colwellia sp. C1TZA3]